MSITKEELYQLYLVEKENKKQMVIKEHVDTIKETILKQNSLGKTSYSTCYWNEDQEYLQCIFTQLNKIFVDSRISVKETINNNRISITTLKIDWKI